MKKLFLIDGNAIVHRAFHAIPKHFADINGVQTNAVYGFTSMLLNIINGQNPDCIAVTFDRPAKTFRHKEFAEYKATRTKAPDELYAQFARIKEVVRAFNIPIYEIDGFEADDVLGTLAVQATAADNELESYIVTGDMDLLQLVNDKVRVFAPQSGFKAPKVYTPVEVEEKYGLTPDQIIDFKAIKGDSSDNIPGVPGIGDKGATTLLQKYKTLDAVYENLDEITGSIHDKLEQNKELAYKSQYLVTIVLDVPVTLDMKACKAHQYDEEKILELFELLRFRSLVPKFEQAQQLGSLGSGATLPPRPENRQPLKKEPIKEPVKAPPVPQQSLF